MSFNTFEKLDELHRTLDGLTAHDFNRDTGISLGNDPDFLHAINIVNELRQYHLVADETVAENPEEKMPAKPRPKFDLSFGRFITDVEACMSKSGDTIKLKVYLDGFKKKPVKLRIPTRIVCLMVLDLPDLSQKAFKHYRYNIENAFLGANDIYDGPISTR